MSAEPESLTSQIANALKMRPEGLREIERATGISKATLSRISNHRPFSSVHLDVLLHYLGMWP